jgi:hypothetical protein
MDTDAEMDMDIRRFGYWISDSGKRFNLMFIAMSDFNLFAVPKVEGSDDRLSPISSITDIGPSAHLRKQHIRTFNSYYVKLYTKYVDHEGHYSYIEFACIFCVCL